VSCGHQRVKIVIPLDVLHVQRIEVLLPLAKAIEHIPPHHDDRRERYERCIKKGASSIACKCRIEREKKVVNIRVVVLLVDHVHLRPGGELHIVVRALQPCA